MTSDDCLHYTNSPYFSDFIIQYLNQSDAVKSLYHRFSDLDSFEPQIIEKKNQFSDSSRQILTNALRLQYKNVQTHENVLQNIAALEEENTFTVTTGHQLNLFSGPLYFIYKIACAIKTSLVLAEKYPAYKFVPVYWMATEDHDFEEIQFFNYKNQKIQWNRESTGPVGRLSLEGLDDVLKTLIPLWSVNQNGHQLLELFENAYLKNENLAAATRYLANALFESYGLVIIDGDDKDLKQSFAPYVVKELTENTINQEVSKTISAFPKNQVQVNPREINVFYITDTIRERIVYENGLWKVLNTAIAKQKHELESWVNENPTCFSPNVLMRPLYQEVVLPNLSYIGGGGEIAYWLELKNAFEAFDVVFPILQVRNSVAVISPKWKRKVEKLGWRVSDFFMEKQSLIFGQIAKLSEVSLNFEPLKMILELQFKFIKEQAEKTDPSFAGALAAQERKQIKGLEALEKRLLKAEHKKHEDTLTRLEALHAQQFPKGILQERVLNFSEIYLTEGASFISEIISDIQPFENRIHLHYAKHD